MQGLPVLKTQQLLGVGSHGAELRTIGAGILKLGSNAITTVVYRAIRASVFWPYAQLLIHVVDNAMNLVKHVVHLLVMHHPLGVTGQADTEKQCGKQKGEAAHSKLSVRSGGHAGRAGTLPRPQAHRTRADGFECGGPGVVPIFIDGFPLAL